MARKIRFPLVMSNGAEVRTIEELRENFDIKSILGYYYEGNLLTWLKDRYYDVEADKITKLNSESKTFIPDIYSALGVDFSEFDNEYEYDLEYLKRRKEKLAILKNNTNAEKAPDRKLHRSADTGQCDILDWLHFIGVCRIDAPFIRLDVCDSSDNRKLADDKPREALLPQIQDMGMERE